jgi:uncharacterized membrane protein
MPVSALNKSSFFSISWNLFKVPKNYILLLFGVIYALISLGNHYNYRTYAFDLGIYNNCLYQYGHFHKNHYPYLHYMFSNFLSDHFSLYTIILSPLHYIFGSTTLLLVQIVSILFGAAGVYKIVKQASNIPFLPEIAMVHFLSFFGIYSALSFDYHDNVVSAMLMPWFFYYFKNNRFGLTWLYALLIVIGKENMPLWLMFVCLGLATAYFKDRQKRNTALLLTLFSVVYAVVILKYVMPNIDPTAPGNGYNQMRYSVLGTNMGELTANIFHHPMKIINALFANHLPDASLNGIKMELYSCLLYSGGWLLIFRPQYLIMLIPVIAQKVLADDFGRWGINYHYSIEFLPVIVIGFYDTLFKLKNARLSKLLAVTVCCMTIYITKATIDKRVSLYYGKESTCFYIPEHYQCEFDKKEVKRVMKLIPKDVNLCAQNCFAAHLSFRKNIYQYPDVYDAEYIMLASSPNAYPVRGPELDAAIRELNESRDWETLSADKGIYLFRKKH